MIGSTLMGVLSGVTSPNKWLVDFVNGGSRTSSGERVNETTALKCAAVYAANRILSETIASLPLDVFRRQPNGDKIPAPEHPVHRLLHDEPNEDTSSFTFRETLQVHLGTWGNGYAEIERAFDGKTPLSLWQRSPKPQYTQPVRRFDTDGKIWYQLRDNAGSEVWVPARNMLHIPGLGFDGMIGYSPVRLMAEVIGLNKAAERYAAELFANDARPNGVVMLPDGPALSDEAYKRTQAAFNDTASEHGRRHRMQLLEGGATYADTQMNPQDVQMIEARRFGIEEVARAYRISLHLLQEFTEGAASYSSIVELGREFIVYTMMPWFKRWQGEINRKLLGDGYFCEFNTAAFLQGDHVARAEFYAKLMEHGGLTINDILRKENMNSIGPEGDTRFVPGNLVTLDRAIKGSPAPQRPALPPPNGRPPEGDGEEERQRAERDWVTEIKTDMQLYSMAQIAAARRRHTETLAAVAAGAADAKTTVEEEGDMTRRTMAVRLDATEGLVCREAVDHATTVLTDTGKILDGVGEATEILAGINDRRSERLEHGRMVYGAAVRQLLTKEEKAAVRQAGELGNFLAWMDAFYVEHEALCLRVFVPAATILDVTAADLTRAHIEQSRELLLGATECKPSELVESVTACVAKWGQRELKIGGESNGDANEG